MTKFCRTFAFWKRRRIKKWQWLILVNIISCFFLYIVFFKWGSTGIPISVVDYKSYAIKFGSKPVVSNLTRILLWTAYHGAYEYQISPNSFQHCPVQCDVTFDKRLLSVSDGVVFHVRDIETEGMPAYHATNQNWIFYLLESSENTCLNLRPYKYIFNLTMTHRMDSDIYHPYARIVKHRNQNLKPSPLHNIRQVLIQKKKLIAWVVSNCYTHSNRESFVEQIQEFTSVDIYGECGSAKCVGQNSQECYSHLAKTYKFYFAFENSLCVDYVTEKFFDSLLYDWVPVVYGDGNYSLVAPPNSYIDARQFKSPKELVNYLLYLDKNPEEYLKYFKWKKFFQIVPSEGWCSLCLRLHQKFETKTYPDIYTWWHTKPGNNSNNGIPACLPYPEYPTENWFMRFRKKQFILHK